MHSFEYGSNMAASAALFETITYSIWSANATSKTESSAKIILLYSPARRLFAKNISFRSQHYLLLTGRKKIIQVAMI